MPPQMESCRPACETVTSPRTRHALAQLSQDAKRGCAPVRAGPKRSAKPRVGGAEAPRASPSTPVENQFLLVRNFNGPDCEQATTAVRERVAAMQEKFGAALEFLAVEFTKLEAQLAPAIGLNSPSRGDHNGPQQQLSRLRYFVSHVHHTVERIEQAKAGHHSYTLAQLDMLDEHISQRLLPVRDRLVAQLTAQRSCSDAASATNMDIDAKDQSATAVKNDDGAAFSSCRPSSSYRFLDNGSLKFDDASAVSDGWMSSDGGATDNELPGASMARRSSSSVSLADLGDLCGDDVRDDCGSAFLVGEDCDGVDGSGIGLDLYDYGQGKDFLLCRDREQTVRADSMSTLSAVSSMTDEELSDDSLSVDAGDAASASCGRKGVNDGAAAGDLSKSGIDHEMGELSELFAPEMFLVSGVADTDDREAADAINTAAPAAVAGSVDAITFEPTVEQAKDANAGVGEGGAKTLSKESAPVSSLSVAGEIKPKLEPSETLPSPSSASSPAPIEAIAVYQQHQQGAVGPSLFATGTIDPIKHEECRCGEASCLSLVGAGTSIAAPRKRHSEGLGHLAPTPGTAVEGSLSYPLLHALHPSFRQRKRQRSSLAPILSAPRTVKYECSLCKEAYQSQVSSNPWWSLFQHECPRCHRVQIPRVDAASAATCVDSIHAVCAEEGEGAESDGYGSDSCSETDDEDDEVQEGVAVFDTDVAAGDNSPGCPARRLSTFQASRLLVLMAHARTCPGLHANPQHAEVCRSTKFLMLHVRDCNGHGPSGELCEHRWCRPCKSLLSHLLRCPEPSACRICMPHDLPDQLLVLRELNVAQARAAAAAATATATAAVKMEGCSESPPTSALTAA